jgi:hypothetical protein
MYFSWLKKRCWVTTAATCAVAGIVAAATKIPNTIKGVTAVTTVANLNPIVIITKHYTVSAVIYHPTVSGIRIDKD